MVAFNKNCHILAFSLVFCLFLPDATSITVGQVALIKIHKTFADYIRVRISFFFFFFRLEKIAIILMLFEKLGVIFDMMHKLRDARLVALIKTIIYFGIFCSNLSIFNRRYNHN